MLAAILAAIADLPGMDFTGAGETMSLLTIVAAVIIVVVLLLAVIVYLRRVAERRQRMKTSSTYVPRGNPKSRQEYERQRNGNLEEDR